MAGRRVLCHRMATQRPKFADKIKGGHMDTRTKKAKNEMEKENKAIRRMKSNPVTKVNIEQSNE